MTPERFHRLRAVLARRQPDLTVLMEGTHKPHNVSAILRSCDAVGVLRAHAVGERGVRLSRGVSRGSSKWVRVRTHRTVEEAVGRLRERGLRIVAATPADDAVDFRDVDYTLPTAVLLGAELHGVSPAAAALADRHVCIPMHGMVASLNVSVAAATILYEAERQRSAAGMYARSRLEPEEHERVLFEWTHPRVAHLCRGRGEPYPPLGPDGEIVGPLPV